MAPQLWADARITAAGTDLGGVNLVVGPGLTMSGKVVFESGTLKSPAVQLRVFLAPASTRRLTEGSAITDLGLVASVTAGPDGTFMLPSVPPGTFRLMLSGPAIDKSPWWPLSAMMGDRDLLDSDFDIGGSGAANLVVTFTDQRSRIEPIPNSGCRIRAGLRPCVQALAALSHWPTCHRGNTSSPL